MGIFKNTIILKTDSLSDIILKKTDRTSISRDYLKTITKEIVRLKQLSSPESLLEITNARRHILLIKNTDIINKVENCFAKSIDGVKNEQHQTLCSKLFKVINKKTGDFFQKNIIKDDDSLTTILEKKDNKENISIKTIDKIKERLNQLESSVKEKDDSVACYKIIIQLKKHIQQTEESNMSSDLKDNIKGLIEIKIINITKNILFNACRRETTEMLVKTGFGEIEIEGFITNINERLNKDPKRISDIINAMALVIKLVSRNKIFLEDKHMREFVSEIFIQPTDVLQSKLDKMPNLNDKTLTLLYKIKNDILDNLKNKKLSESTVNLIVKKIYDLKNSVPIDECVERMKLVNRAIFYIKGEVKNEYVVDLLNMGVDKLKTIVSELEYKNLPRIDKVIYHVVAVIKIVKKRIALLFKKSSQS